MISTIELKLETKIRVLILQGQSGIGKTTILSQFTSKHRKNTIGVFLNNTNRFSYSLDSIASDMYVQFYFFLNGKMPEDVPNNSPLELNKLIQRTHYSLKKNNKKLYIIIDGLSDAPETELEEVKNVIDYMPFNFEHIMFIFSENCGEIRKYINGVRLSEIPVSPMSENEVSKILTTVNEQDIYKIIEIFKAIPELIASIKRLLERGATIDEILQTYSNEEHFGLLEAEWERSKPYVIKHKSIIALIVFSIDPMTTETLVSASGIDLETLMEITKKVSFIEINQNKVLCTTDTMKSFVQDKLKDLKQKSIEKLIDRLSKINSSDSEISKYYAEIGNHSAILNHLNNKTLTEILASTYSLKEISKQLQIGSFSAQTVQSEDSAFRFSHMKTILDVMTDTTPLKNELRCYLEEGDFESAISFISVAKSIEQKIQLLAILAASQKEKNGLVDQDITNQINDLLDSIDPDQFGVEYTVDLALELFPAFPNKAMKLINSLDKLGEGGGNKSEYGFLRFSFELIAKNNDHVDEFIDSMDSIEDRKKEALNMLKLFKKGTPAKKIIESLEVDRDTSNSIFILRKWIASFPDSESSIDLANKAIELILNNSEIHADASIYVDIFTSIQHMTKEDGLALLESIRPQMLDIKRLGPTLDYVNFQLHIYKFEVNSKIKTNRLKELLLFVNNEINDKSVALSALCLISNELNQLKDTSFKEDTESNKYAFFEELISKTADHDTVFRQSLTLEATLNPENAILWASKFNTQSRRDLGRFIIIKELCRSNHLQSVDWMCKEIRKVTNIKKLSTLYIEYLKKLEKTDSITKSDFRKLTKIRSKIYNNVTLCEINARLLNLFERIKEDWPNKKNSLITDLNTSWNNIEGDWHKLDTCFEIFIILHATNREIGTQYKNNASDIRKSGGICTISAIEATKYSLDLATRACYFMARAGYSIDKQGKTIEKLILSIPSRITQAIQLARIASVYHLTNNTNLLNSIVENDIINILDSLHDNHQYEYERSFSWLGPILFIHNKNLFSRYSTPVKDKNNLMDNVCNLTTNYLYRRCIIGDPFDPVQNHIYKLEYRDIEDILFLIKQTNLDAMVFDSTEKLTNELTSNGRIRKLSSPQINSITSQISDLIESKFNDPKHITHDGYKICMKSLLLKLKSEKDKAAWINLEKEAKAVPILSDRIFVIGCIMKHAHASLSEFRKRILRDAVSDIHRLPSSLEKILRYELIANSAKSFDIAYVKQFIKQAVILSTSENTEEYKEKRKELIDSIFNLDREFAKGLSALINDDPARQDIISENVKRKLAEREEKEKFNIENEKIKEMCMSDKYPQIIWNMLGKLNAANHVPNKKSDYIKYLNNISYYSATDAYPLFSYFIHALGKSSQSKSIAERKLKPIFDALISNVELFSVLGDFKTEHLLNEDTHNIDQIVIGEGQEDKAISFVSNCLSSNNFDSIDVIDPYFDLNSLKFIGESIGKDPNFKVRILTSLSGMKLFNEDNTEIPDTIRNYWEKNICSDGIPEFTLIFCGLSSINNSLPVHDRWWLMDRKGIRFGTSMNGIAKKRISEITLMTHDQTLSVQKKVDGYLNSTIREIEGERLKYISYSV